MNKEIRKLKLEKPLEYEDYKKLYKLTKSISEEEYLESKLIQKKKLYNLINLAGIFGTFFIIFFIAFILMFTIAMYWKINYYEVSKLSVSICKEQCNNLNQTYIKTLYNKNLICSCEKQFIVLGG